MLLYFSHTEQRNHWCTFISACFLKGSTKSKGIHFKHRILLLGTILAVLQKRAPKQFAEDGSSLEAVWNYNFMLFVVLG